MEQEEYRQTLIEIAHLLFRKLQVGPTYPLLRQELEKLYPTLNEEIIQQLEISRVAVEELNLQEESVAAILLLPAYNRGALDKKHIAQISSEETASLIERLQHLMQIEAEARQADAATVRELIVSSARDIRVLLILLSDRLYRLRVCKEQLPEEQRQELAVLVRDVYVPIAHKLGLYAIKGEMEDLVLKYLSRIVFMLLRRHLGKRSGSGMPTWIVWS